MAPKLINIVLCFEMMRKYSANSDESTLLWEFSC